MEGACSIHEIVFEVADVVASAVGDDSYSIDFGDFSKQVDFLMRVGDSCENCSLFLLEVEVVDEDEMGFVFKTEND